jgi:cytochrome c-type biogenesis protein CcmH/NrfG
MTRSLLPTLCAALAATSLVACKRSDRPREAEAPAPAPAAPAGQMPQIPPPQMPPPGQMPPTGAMGGDAAAQITALEQATKKNPTDHEAWVQLGNLYFDTHQPKQSIDAYSKALELQPNDPNVLTDQGVMYRELKSYDRAIANFEKASQVDPSHVQSLYNLGIVYAHDLRQPQKAAAAWQKVIAVAPSSPQATQARQALEQLGVK